jgi:MFS family permease
MAMAAESVAREEMPRAIGVVQMGQRLGPAIGPIVGGVLAPIVGLRRAFLVTAGFYLVAMVMVALVYREPRTRTTRTAARSLGSVARELLATPGFLLALAVIFTLQTVDRSFSPILPLFVEQLGVTGTRVATVSGVLFSMIAVCAAIGHKAAVGLMRRWSSRALIAAVAVTTALALIAIIVLPTMWTLTAGLVVASLGIGVAMTAAYSVAGSLLPADAHVTGFGIMTTASLVGLAFSPVLAGFVGASGLRIVFVVDVVLLLALLLGLARARPVPQVPQVPQVPDVPQVP